MKKILFVVLMALVSLTTVLAQNEGVKFTSKETGITFRVPENCKILQDDVQAVILQTPDQQTPLPPRLSMSRRLLRTRLPNTCMIWQLLPVWI